MKVPEKTYLSFMAPYLAALFPFFHLLAINIKEIQLIYAVRTFLIIIAFVSIGNLMVRSFFKNNHKAYFIFSTLIIVGLSSGHIVNSVNTLKHIGDRYIILAVLIFCIVFVWKIIKMKNFSKNAIRYFSFALIFLIVISILRIVTYLLSIKSSVLDNTKNASQTFDRLKKMPDVYYIILDAHARDDVLAEMYGQNNHFLTNYLESKGFFVAGKSNSNYLFTHASVSSSLNLNYLDSLVSNFDIHNVDSRVWDQLIENSIVSQKLKGFGYSYYTFRSGFSSLHQNPYADKYYGYQINLNNFEITFINSSILRYASNLFFDITASHKNNVLFIFETLKNISKDKKPTFTYAHIVSPHAPFIFDDKGNYIGRGKELSYVENPLKEGKSIEEYRKLYLNQLIFIDNKTIETIDFILNNSDTPPIIVVQGDHGPPTEYHLQGDLTDLAFKERSGILNAYYLPNCTGEKKPYSTISPVNSFRLIFGSCFGEDFELLEDKTIKYFENR